MTGRPSQKAYQKKWRADNREKILAYQVGYRAERKKNKSDPKAEKKNVPIWELDRKDEYSNDVFATLTRGGRSAFCMLRTSEREEYLVADPGLIDDPAGWEILERLYQAHGPTIVFWGRSGHSWLCQYRHETGWRALPVPVRRMAGLMAALHSTGMRFDTEHPQTKVTSGLAPNQFPKKKPRRSQGGMNKPFEAKVQT